MVSETKIMEELQSIKEDLKFIKKHMIDRDALLSPEERALHKQGMKEYEEGKTATLDEVEQEIISVPHSTS